MEFGLYQVGKNKRFACGYIFYLDDFVSFLLCPMFVSVIHLFNKYLPQILCAKLNPRHSGYTDKNLALLELTLWQGETHNKIIHT